MEAIVGVLIFIALTAVALGIGFLLAKALSDDDDDDWFNWSYA